MTRAGITVIVPSIPPRAELLARALTSVTAQTCQPAAISVAIDHDRQGAPATRDRALHAVQTEWVACLDDDDELETFHLATLAEWQADTDADLVFPWFTVINGDDPFPQWFGVPWDNSHQRQVPITWLARTDAIRSVGGFTYEWDPSQGEDPGLDPDGNRAGEDYRLVRRLVNAGAKIVHLPERTWRWHHGPHVNTMGLPGRW